MYGLPTGAAGPTYAPQYVGQVSGTSKTPSLPLMPGVRDILVACTASVQGSGAAPSVSGAGATWTQVIRRNSTNGSQIDFALWVGIVGPSPTTSIAFAWTNTGCGGVAMFRNRGGMTGAFTSGGGGRTPESAATRSLGGSMVAVRDRGVLVHGFGYRGTLNSVNGSGWSNVFAPVNGAGLRLYYLPGVPQPGEYYGMGVQATDQFAWQIAAIE